MFSLASPGPHLMLQGFGEPRENQRLCPCLRRASCRAHWTTQARPQGPLGRLEVLTRPLSLSRKTGESGQDPGEGPAPLSD